MTAVVSGRDLDTLAMLTRLRADDGITLIGSHGAHENRAAVDVSASTPGATRLDGSASQLLETLDGELKGIRVHWPAVRLERKPAAVALHARGVKRSTGAGGAPAALEVGARHAGVLLPGKEVVELSVSAADKGAALTGLALASRSDATLYLGDDATDERAFAAFHPSSGDLTIDAGNLRPRTCRVMAVRT